MISGFAAGDRIEFSNGITINSVTVLNGNTLAIVNHNSLNITGTYDLTDVGFAAGTVLSFISGTDPITNDAYVMPTQYFFWTGASNAVFGNGANWTAGVAWWPSPWRTPGASTSPGRTSRRRRRAPRTAFYNTGTWSVAPGTSLSAALAINIGAGGGGTASAGALTIGSGSTVNAGGFINVGDGAGNISVLTVSGGGVLNKTSDR